MRTTVELPDDLFRKVKAAAASRGMKLKDLIARMLERGLREGFEEPKRGHAGPIPTLDTGPLRVPTTSNADLMEFLDREDERK